MKPLYLGVNTLNFLYWLISSPSNSLESHLMISCIWACLGKRKNTFKMSVDFVLFCIPICGEKTLSAQLFRTHYLPNNTAMWLDESILGWFENKDFTRHKFWARNSMQKIMTKHFQKTFILGLFLTLSPQNWGKRIFSKKPGFLFYGYYRPQAACLKSEKRNEPFREKVVTD